MKPEPQVFFLRLIKACIPTLIQDKKSNDEGHRKASFREIQEQMT
jgi:hypothetical protein